MFSLQDERGGRAGKGAADNYDVIIELSIATEMMASA